MAAILTKTWWKTIVKGEKDEDIEESSDLSGSELSIHRENKMSEQNLPVEDRRSLDHSEIEHRDVEGSELDEEDDEVDVIEPQSEDPLQEPFDLDPIQPKRRGHRKRFFSDSIKEFFSEEIQERFSELDEKERSLLAGTYRIELQGTGKWDLMVTPSALKVEVSKDVFSGDLHVGYRTVDFVLIINGDLHPQLSLVSQKLRMRGDLKKAVHLHSMLSPMH